jgi:hypothetical protein
VASGGPYLIPTTALLARLVFPHLCRVPFSPMHWDLLERQEAVWKRPAGARGRRLAVAAPRGHAKSTLASLILPLLDLGRGRQPYIVLLSATVRQAAARLRNLRHELDSNGVLRAHWPHLAMRAKPRTTRSVAVAGAMVEAHGALSEIRGLNHGGHRPSLIVLDDTDATGRVRSADQRAALLAWFDEVVEPLGDRQTDIVVVGTILHQDSLLGTLLRRPTWEGVVWQALPQGPKNPGLWTQWMTLLTCPDDPEAERVAREFFHQHRLDMLAGARALWPQRDSVLDLHRYIAILGHGSFRKEKQNDPAPLVCGPWNPAGWHRFVIRQEVIQHLAPPMRPEGAEGPAEPVAGPLLLRNLATYGYLDPATGRPGRSGRQNDFAALVTIGRAPGADPRYYLLDVWLAREGIQTQARVVAEAATRWGWLGFAYEANGFQSVLGPQLASALAKAARETGTAPLVPLAVTHSQAKALRIERAALLLASGRIQFHAHLPQEFIQQATDYPLPGTHDDGLDALAAGLEFARSRNPAQQGRVIGSVRRREPNHF